MEKVHLTFIRETEIFRRKINAPPRNKALLQEAKNLRKAGVLAEVLFWQQVRNDEFYEIDFDRQRIIGDYIVDFYVRSLGLVVEIDHESETNNDEDEKQKFRFLDSLDLKVFRVSNDRVKYDLPQVMQELEDFIILHFS